MKVPFSGTLSSVNDKPMSKIFFFFLNKLFTEKCHFSKVSSNRFVDQTKYDWIFDISFVKWRFLNKLFKKYFISTWEHTKPIHKIKINNIKLVLKSLGRFSFCNIYRTLFIIICKLSAKKLFKVNFKCYILKIMRSKLYLLYTRCISKLE